MINIEQLVKEPHWKSLLIDLVITNKLDPWNIDLEILLKKFKEKLILYKDFNIPANILLAYAILLKYKAMFLEIPEPTYNENNIIEIKEEPPLLRRKRKLPITLDELIHVIEKSIKKHRKKRKKHPLNHAVETQKYELEEDLFEKELEEFEKIVKNKSLYLSQIPGDILKNFLFMLLLTNEGKIMFEQEKPYEDIYIRWLDEKTHN